MVHHIITSWQDIINTVNHQTALAFHSRKKRHLILAHLNLRQQLTFLRGARWAYCPVGGYLVLEWVSISVRKSELKGTFSEQVELLRSLN